MKKILLLILSITMLGVVGCSSSETEEKEVKDEQITKVELSEDTKKTIEENLSTFTEGTAFDGAEFKVELVKNELKVSVIKNINDIMETYKTTNSDDTVNAIKKSLTFNDAYDAIKEEIELKVDCMQVFIYNGEDELKNNEYYTLKSIM